MTDFALLNNKNPAGMPPGIETSAGVSNMATDSPTNTPKFLSITCAFNMYFFDVSKSAIICLNSVIFFSSPEHR
jgi:hypothetical protein